MQTSTESAVTVEELTDEQGRQMFEERCQELLGMSTDEFLRKYDDGTIWEIGREEAVTQLSMLIPFVR